jgi:uncharacterized membrane protein
VTNFPVQYNKAIVGRNAFAHESGIHQDGMLKNANTYEIMTPESVGVSKTSLVMGKHSGRNAFRSKLGELGYQLGENAFEDAFNRFKALADRKKHVYDEDIEALVDGEIASANDRIRVLSLTVIAGTMGPQSATITLDIEGEHKTVQATGNGPVDAIFNSVNALVPNQASLELYQVSAVTSGTDAQAEVSVRIQEEGKTTTGRAADTDTLAASAKAYVSALNKLMARRQKTRRGGAQGGVKARPPELGHPGVQSPAKIASPGRGRVRARRAEQGEGPEAFRRGHDPHPVAVATRPLPSRERNKRQPAFDPGRFPRPRESNFPMRLDAPASASAARLPLIDAARGVAIVAMAVYHFAWDLRFFGYISADVGGDLGWRIFARSIAGSFLLLVGVSLVLASRHGFDRSRFLRRLAILAAAAAAVTAVTYFVFPDAFVFFGILHCIVLSSVLALPFLRAPVLVTIAAAAFVLVLPHLFRHSLFDHPALLWIGLFTVPPRSNDFVPILPWLGIVLLGVAAARLLGTPSASGERGARTRALGSSQMVPNTEEFPVSGPSSAKILRPLVWAGRRSLPIYLLHQPLFFGLVYAAAQVAPPPPPNFRTLHNQSCTAQCVASGEADFRCRTACACVTGGAEAAGLADPLMANALSEAQLARYYEIAAQCRVQESR